MCNYGHKQKGEREEERPRDLVWNPSLFFPFPSLLVNSTRVFFSPPLPPLHTAIKERPDVSSLSFFLPVISSLFFFPFFPFSLPPLGEYFQRRSGRRVREHFFFFRILPCPFISFPLLSPPGEERGKCNRRCYTLLPPPPLAFRPLFPHLPFPILAPDGGVGNVTWQGINPFLSTLFCPPFSPPPPPPCHVRPKKIGMTDYFSLSFF